MQNRDGMPVQNVLISTACAASHSDVKLVLSLKRQCVFFFFCWLSCFRQISDQLNIYLSLHAVNKASLCFLVHPLGTASALVCCLNCTMCSDN